MALGLPPVPKRLESSLSRFRREEDGSLILFTLVLLVLMLAMGGLAVDLMRHEQVRIGLQAATDRAALAAASRRQRMEIEEIVHTYLEKAGLRAHLSRIEATERDGRRNVEIATEIEVPLFFGPLLGISSLMARAASTAEEQAASIEISLVLDISGSMRFPISDFSNYTDRMHALREAAGNFVDEVLRSKANGTISINVIPYAGQVNVGPDLYGLLNPARTYGESSCIDVADGDYSTATLPRNRAQTPPFMYFVIDWPSMDWGWCPLDRTAIRVAQNDPGSIKQMIRDMRLHDGTGTQYAMKYAVALLNPAERPLFAQLAANGRISPDFADRPLNYNEDGAEKYIVLMTDGEITDQFRPVNPQGAENATVELRLQPGSATVMTTNKNVAITQFNAQCNLARAQGITVFTIAFETNLNGQNAMRSCATTPSHFFPVTGGGLDPAFKAIASQITQLRLVR